MNGFHPRPAALIGAKRGVNTEYDINAGLQHSDVSCFTIELTGWPLSVKRAPCFTSATHQMHHPLRLAVALSFFFVLGRTHLERCGVVVFPVRHPRPHDMCCT